jgi:hypothetical protein
MGEKRKRGERTMESRGEYPYIRIYICIYIYIYMYICIYGYMCYILILPSLTNDTECAG